MRRAAAPLALAWLALAGCADQMLSDARIRDQAAMALGQPASAVSITDRRYDGMTNTFVIARTPRGTYRCTINGGGVLAMGIVNPAVCTPLQSLLRVTFALLPEDASQTADKCKPLHIAVDSHFVALADWDACNGMAAADGPCHGDLTPQK